MKPRSLLVLALVVAALGAFIWFFERELPSTDERAERAKKVLPIEIDEVTAIEIRVADAVTRLEKVEPPATDAGDPEDDELAAPPEPEWRLVAPLAARADGEAVEDLVRALVELEKERTLEDVVAADLGLAAPRATVVLTAGGEELVLRVGEEVPASSNLLVDRGGESGEAYVVADRFWSDLGQPAGDWRSRRAFTAEREDVAALRLRGGAVEVVLRRGEGGFVVEAPYRDEADRDQVEDLLSALVDLEVEEFLDQPADAAALGLAPAAAAVRVELTGGGAPIDVALGLPTDAGEEGGEAAADPLGSAGGGTRYVEVGAQRFTADTDLGELIARPADSWRSTAWSRREVYEIDAVAVKRGGEEALRLERADGQWRRDGVEIPYTAASDLLYAVRDAEAERVVERSAFGPLDSPLYEITLIAGDSEETLRVHPPRADGGYPAERAGREPLLLLPASAIDELTAKLEAAQRAEPVPEPEPIEDP